MNAIRALEEVDHDRRRFLGTAAVVAANFSCPVPLLWNPMRSAHLHRRLNCNCLRRTLIGFRKLFVKESTP
jgi:hypothetical protein